MYIPNFNSHAHVERDDPHIIIGKMNDISTHTLTWSVTDHAYADFRRCEHFNSHAHVERDELLDQAADKLMISTHTLTWSVTVTAYQWTSLHQFQLTRSRGA